MKRVNMKNKVPNVAAYLALVTLVLAAIAPVEVLANGTSGCHGTIGNFVWHDLNCNGIQDSGEPGIEGVTLNLWKNWKIIATTVTHANGSYWFTGLCAGWYGVKVDQTTVPAGFVLTEIMVGGDPTIDSNKSIAILCLPTNCSFNLTIDFGYCRIADCKLDVMIEGCLIVPPVAPNGNDCQGKVTRMTLEYTGEGCDASSNSQAAKKVKCDGDPAMTEPVSIRVTNKNGKKTWASASGIPIGGQVIATAANAGKDNLDADTLVTITNANGNADGDVLQQVKFHTSCSQPLNVGDQFGSLLLVSLTTTKGGEVSLDEDQDDGVCVTELPSSDMPFDVEYTYTIENTGNTDLTDITVIDDTFGEVPGSPIPLIPVGETVILTLVASLTEETTNTVVVTATAGPAICEAEATATITKEEPPPGPVECTTKIQAMLLQYIGPDIDNATVTFIADKFKDEPVVYSNVDLTAGVVLSSPAENNMTIDALAHGHNELRAKVKIVINGAEEVIHTSCSTPFVIGEPAPLDKPKGAPSPNWFVVAFRQK